MIAVDKSPQKLYRTCLIPMDKLFVIFGLSLLSFFSFVAPVAYSQNNCTIIYGGGEIGCEATVSATTKVSPSPTRAPVQQPAANSEQNTTKGGLPVHEPTKATETPATGPESIALMSLIPMAAAGFLLKRLK
jgi:hypothetical protein